MEFDASFVRVRIPDVDGEVNAAAAQDDVAQGIIWIPEIMGFCVRRAVKLRLPRRTSHKVSAAFVLLGRYSFPILYAVPRNFSFPPYGRCTRMRHNNDWRDRNIALEPEKDEWEFLDVLLLPLRW